MTTDWTQYGVGGLLALEAFRTFRAWLRTRALKAGRRPTEPNDDEGARAKLRLELREDRFLDKLSESFASLTANLKELNRATTRIEFKLDERNRRNAN